ncbi:MAG: M56 family metallopeptidase, partial [Clostridia bacterium]|nr:M56 family metallopeptidase [Clostridia bacterium]
MKILNMSITAGWLVLVVILLRLLLNKAPKAIRCLLWGLVGLRLLCPFSFESVLSLIPSAETVPQEILYTAEPAVNTGFESVNQAVNPILNESFAPQPWESVNPLQVITYVAAWVWLAGVAGMLLYAAVSYWRLFRRVRVSMPLEGNVYLCDAVETPFILGIFKPRVYLPSAMDAEQREAVLQHEQAHLKRKDHWWKPLGFALLAVHWFNPLMWVAYILLCRDIELACDEKVIQAMDPDEKKVYSEALLCCSVPRRSIAACPLAFGEVGVKSRIRSVLSYKKPAFWLIFLAFLLCIGAAIFFLTDPPPQQNLPAFTSNSELEGLSLELKELDLDLTPSATVAWVNRSGKQVLFGEFFDLQYLQDGEWVDCELRKDRVFFTVGYMVKNNG